MAESYRRGVLGSRAAWPAASCAGSRWFQAELRR